MSNISVVIPTHNTRALTLTCLEHLERAALIYRREVRAEVETVVVDDASADDTVEQIESRFPGVSIARQPSVMGFTRSVNLGLEQTSGDPLLLLNSDTEIEQRSLLRLAAALEAREFSIVSPQLVYPDGRAQWTGGDEPTLLWLFLLSSGMARGLSHGSKLYRSLRTDQRRLDRRTGNAPRPTGWVSGAAMMLRRDLLEQIGPFDERYRFFAQDLDFCSRARAAGHRIAIVPDATVVHHLGGSATDGAQRTEQLWLDLLTWASCFRGPSWTNRARLCLRLGGGLGLLASHFEPRAEVRRDRKRNLRRALRALATPETG